MALVQVSARLNPDTLKRAKKALGTKTTSETLQKALDLITEKAANDAVIRKFGGVGGADSFR